MRWTSHYGSCLNVGADPAGVKISVLFPFRPGHPPLLIPWSEISVASRRKFLFIRRVKLLLGREEQIPFVISGGLADRIQAAAGYKLASRTCFLSSRVGAVSINSVRQSVAENQPESG